MMLILFSSDFEVLSKKRKKKVFRAKCHYFLRILKKKVFTVQRADFIRKWHVRFRLLGGCICYKSAPVPVTKSGFIFYCFFFHIMCIHFQCSSVHAYLLLLLFCMYLPSLAKKYHNFGLLIKHEMHFQNPESIRQ